MSHSIRVVTAAALFDGHDAAINIMRRILQDQGAEVIHLGHNRSVEDVAQAALQEGAHAVAVSSYQGGHMEYFKYLKTLLTQAHADYVKIYGGGGGVIVHEEKAELEAFGIDQIFHPDDGRRLGLEGMIRQIIDACQYKVEERAHVFKPYNIRPGCVIPSRDLGLAISEIENQGEPGSFGHHVLEHFPQSKQQKPIVIGITGTGGAGKSSLIDELLLRFLEWNQQLKIAVICVDPTKKKTGGALLGDRIRMNSTSRAGVFMRSLASRGSGIEIARSLPQVLTFLKQLDFDLIIAETSGIGQASAAVVEHVDIPLYVMTSEFGAPSQLEKIDMIDFADIIVINKADRRGAQDALREVRKTYLRSHKQFGADPATAPVVLTQSSQFQDPGVNRLFELCVAKLSQKDPRWRAMPTPQPMASDHRTSIVPPDRVNYLARITQCVRDYKLQTDTMLLTARRLQAYEIVASENPNLNVSLPNVDDRDEVQGLIDSWPAVREAYSKDQLEYSVRGRTITQPRVSRSLSGLSIPRVIAPVLDDYAERVRFLRMENLPGHFPYTSGVFPLKRKEEEPLRQFAGEGPPEKTNRRFHFLSQDSKVKRLSTAFDSVTLYGEDPDPRPDIFGKVGESGVSIATLDDMKRLYAGFDLCNPETSVSMTINGPAPMILALFLNTAIDQELDKAVASRQRPLTQYEQDEIAAQTLQTVRGTVQADILKEDQGQNTCIFSVDFALKMMGDIQEYFIEQRVRNFYSVSISGYHIAEAGANPITQLALTLSNAFTFVEYYLARGLKVDEFAPNLSFFFSNGLDPEYTVIGRVARRIWAIALRDLYHGNARSQMLKYHIQTSGRSLHAQEIAFNDIRTTLQALLAIQDSCNSLHTNAYDEAITTPTEESVRRAQAIQLIINREFGLSKNENTWQGSYFVEWLTDQVEEAVLEEFLRLNERGGVLGAMETQYQRGRIQDESMHYEMLKHSGELPVIGVNTFIDPETLKADYTPPKIQMARATFEEKQLQLERVRDFQKRHQAVSGQAINQLKQVARSGGNIFAELMKAARVLSLKQMTDALYEVGGQYRRNV